MHAVAAFSRSFQLRQSYIEISRFIHPLTSRTSRPEHCPQFTTTSRRTLCLSQQRSFRPSPPLLQEPAEAEAPHDVSPAVSPTPTPQKDLFSRYSRNSRLPRHNASPPFTLADYLRFLLQGCQSMEGDTSHDRPEGGPTGLHYRASPGW